jgi:hypothetical protein
MFRPPRFGMTASRLAGYPAALGPPFGGLHGRRLASSETSEAPLLTVLRALIVMALALLPLSAYGQEQDAALSPRALAAAIALDPTTYAPAVSSYASARLDWDSSQPLLRNGFLEANPRFTISGRPQDAAISYEAGKGRILGDAFVVLELSALNNLIERVALQTLSQRYPEHRKLIRRVGFIERIAVASLMSYQLSEAHLRQWRANQDLARQLGY